MQMNVTSLEEIVKKQWMKKSGARIMRHLE